MSRTVEGMHFSSLVVWYKQGLSSKLATTAPVTDSTERMEGARKPLSKRASLLRLSHFSYAHNNPSFSTSARSRQLRVVS